jgi:MFS family permease
VCTAFAVSVIVARIALGWMPDRLGPFPCAAASGIVEAGGLAAIALAQSIAVAVAGAIAMGIAFGLLFPSFALIVVNRVPDGRRGAAMGTYTAFFDLGFGLGSPLAGVAAAIGGYPAAFAFAAGCSVGIIAVVGSLRRGDAGAPVAVVSGSAGPARR